MIRGIKYLTNAQWRHGFQRHVSRSLNGPFVVLLEQQSTDQTGDCGIVRKDADDVGPAFDFAVQPFDGVGRMQLGAVFLREGHVSQHVGLGVIHDRRQPGHLRSDLVGDRPPLGAGGLGGVLREGGCDEG